MCTSCSGESTVKVPEGMDAGAIDRTNEAIKASRNGNTMPDVLAELKLNGSKISYDARQSEGLRVLSQTDGLDPTVKALLEMILKDHDAKREAARGVNTAAFKTTGPVLAAWANVLPRDKAAGIII